MSIRNVQQNQWPLSGHVSGNRRAPLLDGASGGGSDGS